MRDRWVGIFYSDMLELLDYLETVTAPYTEAKHVRFLPHVVRGDHHREQNTHAVGLSNNWKIITSIRERHPSTKYNSSKYVALLYTNFPLR